MLTVWRSVSPDPQALRARRDPLGWQGPYPMPLALQMGGDLREDLLLPGIRARRGQQHRSLRQAIGYCLPFLLNTAATTPALGLRYPAGRQAAGVLWVVC